MALNFIVRPLVFLVGSGAECVEGWLFCIFALASRNLKEIDTDLVCINSIQGKNFRTLMWKG